jgi:O-antigen/teichoic acid export membrane protein
MRLDLDHEVGFERLREKPRIGAGAFLGTFVTSLFISLLTVLQGVLVARLLGPVGRGELAAVLLWPTLFAGISIFGSNIAISRAAATEGHLETIGRTAVIVGLATSLLGSVTCYIAIPWLMPSDQAHLVPIARLFVLFMPANHVGLNLLAIDQGKAHFRKFNLMRTMLNLVYLGLVAMIWIFGRVSVGWLAAAQLLANVAVVCARFAALFRHHPLKGKIYSPVRIIRQSFRFGLAGIANPVFAQIDKVLLLWLLGAESLGLYVVALSASSALSSVTQASGLVGFSIAAQASPGDGFGLVAKSFRLSLLSWLVLGGALGLILPWMLSTLYGGDFVAAATPARVLIVGSAFAGLSSQLDQAVRGQGRAFIGLEGRLAGLVVMAAISVVLSPVMGIVGVCVGFVFGQLVNLLVIIQRTNSHYGLRQSLGHYLPCRSDIRSVLSLLRTYLPGKLRS